MPLQVIHSTDDRRLQDIADALIRSRKVVVIAGAGISTSCGIPDFRSKDGLYKLIPAQGLITPPPSQPSTPSRKRKYSELEDDHFPFSSQRSTASSTSRRSEVSKKLRGQDLFDSRVWKDSATTETFYQFIASLRQKVIDEVSETSLAHKFIRTLRDGGRLVRCYTQNIDGLESREGLCADLSRGRGCKRRFMRKNFEVPRPHETVSTEFDGGCEVVPLHGELSTVRCALCQQVRQWSKEDTSLFLEGDAPTCDSCSRKSDDREAKGKRGVAVGLMRPNVVLYGEEHPQNELLAPLVPFDISSNPEVLIVMGTSLKVFGLQKIVRDFARAIHARKDKKGFVIFVNRTSPAESIWDGVIDQYIAMDCDDWIKDLRERREDLWLRQGELDLKITKPIAKRKRTSENADERHAKMPKVTLQKIISVDIPCPGPLSSSCQQTSLPPEKWNVPAIADHVDGQNYLTMTTPATPCRSRQWKRNMYNNPLEDLDLPEHASFWPMRKSFKPLIFMPDIPVSPEPPAYSPLRKSFKKSNSGFDLPTSPERPQYSPMNAASRNHLRNVIYANSHGCHPQVDRKQEKPSIVSQLQKQMMFGRLISHMAWLKEHSVWKDSYLSKIQLTGEITLRDDDKENQAR